MTIAQQRTNKARKTSHGNAGVWKAWKAKKPAFHPSHTPWKSLRGFPHSHGYYDDYHVSEDRQSPPKTRNQSHSHRKGLVNHVPGLKRKGCPGTLKEMPPAGVDDPRRGVAGEVSNCRWHSTDRPGGDALLLHLLAPSRSVLHVVQVLDQTGAGRVPSQRLAGPLA